MDGRRTTWPACVRGCWVCRSSGSSSLRNCRQTTTTDHWHSCFLHLQFPFNNNNNNNSVFVLNCITEIDENYASFCLVNMSTVLNFLVFTINAVLHPIFIRKLCYKLSSIVTFTFIQIFLSKFCLLYWMASELPRLLDTASKLALFSVSCLKDEKLIKKQTYMETETCKLYSRVFWIFLPNFIKIDPYNFELYRFKVGAFFETQCSDVKWRIHPCYVSKKSKLSGLSLSMHNCYKSITPLKIIYCNWISSTARTKTAISVLHRHRFNV